jgi:hypothetical protein
MPPSSFICRRRPVAYRDTLTAWSIVNVRLLAC